MRKFIVDFSKRGLVGFGVGPIVLAIVYIILGQSGKMDTLTIRQVCIGIFSLSFLGFIVGGMNAIYQIEQIQLMPAIFIHGAILYVAYLGAYLINNWIEFSIIPIIVFSIIFVVGYIVIWCIIYAIVKRSTSDINEKLRKKNQSVKSLDMA